MSEVKEPQRKPLTRAEAEDLIGERIPDDDGLIIGVSNRPPSFQGDDGVFLVISHHDKKATYIKVD